MNLMDQVKETIQRFSLLEKGDRVVVGFSGGPDSMALLDLLFMLKEEYGLTLIPAHLNHGFRGREADEDLLFCKKAAADYGLELISETVDIPGKIRELGLSPQAAAREVRYAFLIRVQKEHKGTRIALGHHAHDQAETFFMNLLRGSGVTGLTGIPIRREPFIIRPLLHSTRWDILKYLKERRLSFRTDSSNEKEIYLRNRVRQELIPLLQENYNPNLIKDLERTSEVLREEDIYMEQQARQYFVPIPIPGGVALDMTVFQKIPKALVRRIVRMAIAQAGGGLRGITFSHVHAVFQLMESEGSSKRIDLPCAMTVRKVYNQLEFCRKVSDSTFSEWHELSVPGIEVIPSLEIEVESMIISPEEVPGNLDQRSALFDLEKCSLPLRIRTREPGDIFFPKGFGKTKKVKRFYIDEKVPFPVRDHVPILVNCKNEILWVCGYRMDNRFTVDERTSRTLLVRINKRNGE